MKKIKVNIEQFEFMNVVYDVHNNLFSSFSFTGKEIVDLGVQRGYKISKCNELLGQLKELKIINHVADDFYELVYPLKCGIEYMEVV
jgi:hypothetical protein